MSVWPIGSALFAVDELIAAGRALDRAAQEGKPVNTANACTVVDTLAAYIASLPAETQATVSRRLVEALNERLRFTPTVAPKGTLPKRGKA